MMVAFGAVISVQASSTLGDTVEEEMTEMAESQAGELDSWLQSTQRSIMVHLITRR